MKITFTWSPYFISKKSINNFYDINFYGYSFYDSLVKHLINVGKYDQYKNILHDLFENCNFKKTFQYKTKTSIYDDIYDVISKFINYIEDLKIDIDGEFIINFNISADEYIEKIIGQISWKDYVVNKTEKIGRNIPYLEEKLKKHCCGFKNQYVFNFDAFVPGILSTSGGEAFVFEAYICNLKQQISEFVEATQQLARLGEKKHKLKPSYYLNIQWLNNWLLSVEHNITNFLSVTNWLLNEIKNSVKNFKKINYKLITSSRIWNSLLFELFKPTYMNSGVKSLTNVFQTIKNQKLVDLKSNIFDYIYDKNVENKFTQNFMNKWTKKLLEIRNQNFHLSNDKEIFDEDYLLVYLNPYGQFNSQNINTTIDFIINVQDLVLISFCYVWQIFNYLTGTILNTSQNFKAYLEQLSSKEEQFTIDENTSNLKDKN